MESFNKLKVGMVLMNHIKQFCLALLETTLAIEINIFSGALPAHVHNY